MPIGTAEGTTREHEKAKRIRELNDQFRTTLVGGRVVVTPGVHALGPLRVMALLERVRRFSEFNPDNDPYCEHDFGAFDEHRAKYFWKIEYYDRRLVAGSEDPSDPTKTTRVITLMTAHEY